MCGITGYYAYKEKHSTNITKIPQSTQKLELRGPDCGNIYNDINIALGHRRLSIIDVSDSAAQPMSDGSGRYTIVFNGEIFNYRELSKKYLQEYWQENGGPRTSSDTEALLGLLITYGAKCLEWLSGFFAFAFYDKETGELLLARDRYGKKPLLYYMGNGFVAFASEMKALLEYNIPKEIDYTVASQYFQLNYIPQPQSILMGVAKLRPAHYLIFSRNGLEEYAPYYTLQTHPELYSRLSYKDAKDELVQLMDEAVRERMISDVPLGAFLSGGVDSSVIVALASKYTSQLNTFSVGYKDNTFFDETKYAKAVAERYKTNHTVFSLGNSDFIEHIYNVLDYLDEPFADSSAIPVFILSKYTRKHVTVALSGDGGDEVFAGYNKHAAEWKMRQNSLANRLVKSGKPLWNSLPRSRNSKMTNLFRQLHRFAEGAELPVKDRYWRWASFIKEKEAAYLFRKEISAEIDNGVLNQEKQFFLSGIKSEDFNEILLTDMNLVLAGDMLVKVDMMSMANSLEIRSPFLSHKVVDFAFSLPAEYKVDGKMKKKIVQDAFRSMLPAEIYNRPKHGFEIPLLDWFRNELWGLINDDLLSEKFVEDQGIFNPKAIENLKQKLVSNNPEDSHATIWALVVFQYWWKKYFA